MKLSTLLSVFLMSLLLTSTIICQDKTTREKHKRQSEGEEPGTRLKANEVYDHTRKGIRLVLSYNKASSSFEGSVENVSKKTIKSVRVEVHLSNDVELGPTTPIDLSPKEKRPVILSARGQDFKWYKAHPEAGEGEHGMKERGEHRREERGEHREKRGEHDRKEKREHKEKED